MPEPSTSTAGRSSRFWYLIDVPTFADSNGDGIGDLPGVCLALDYLAWIGVDVIWLLPFYPSPRMDNGYDVIQHDAVDPRFGTLDDLRQLCHQAHRRGIRIVIDLVFNHTSDRHPWFREASAAPDSPLHDRYVWTDSPASFPPQEPVFPGDERTIWTYVPAVGQFYLHNFLSNEPELNPAAPEVRAEFHRIGAYWLDQGVDGFRIDAAPFLGSRLKPGAPDSRAIVTDIETALHARHPDLILALEADLDPPDLPSYMHSPAGWPRQLFNFQISQHLFAALGSGKAAPLVRAIERSAVAAQPDVWINFPRNADEMSLSRLTPEDRIGVWQRYAPRPDMRIYGRGIRRRLGSLLEGDSRQIRLVHSLIASLPGDPLIVAGDELGVPDDLSLPGRYATRTPMQWGPLARLGLAPDMTSTTLLIPDRQREALVPHRARPVAIPDAEPLLTWMHELAHARRTWSGRGRGCDEEGFVNGITANDHVLIHGRTTGAGPMVFAQNCSSLTQRAVVPRTQLASPVFGQANVCSAPDGTTLELPAYGFAWMPAAPPEHPTALDPG